jgi:predicted enzyme related to lactoylglutathione lyase
MKAHVSWIPLGVDGMARSRRFYAEVLGWKVQRDHWRRAATGRHHHQREEGIDDDGERRTRPR